MTSGPTPAVSSDTDRLSVQGIPALVVLLQCVGAPPELEGRLQGFISCLTCCSMAEDTRDGVYLPTSLFELGGRTGRQSGPLPLTLGA